MKIFSLLCLIALTIWNPKPVAAQEDPYKKQQVIDIGDLKLESGQVIEACKLGIRTFGKPNANQSNIILFPTWFSGTTADLEQTVPVKLIDTNKYFIILVDALGDGISSSPSNSPTQPRLSFPVFSVRDMVESQYRLLTEKLHISHLLAIAGISMGGMQAFQWALSYPKFMDKIIPIVGSPQLTSNDLLLWNGELRAIQADTAYHDGNYQGIPPMPAVAVMHRLAAGTPEYFSNSIARPEFDHWFQDIIARNNFDWNNWVRQLQAMIGQDIAKPYAGSLPEAAALIRARMLIVVSNQDHMVNPIPARRMAGYAHARLLELTSNCGHMAPGCESVKLRQAIQSFLSPPR